MKSHWLPSPVVETDFRLTSNLDFTMLCCNSKELIDSGPTEFLITGVSFLLSAERTIQGEAHLEVIVIFLFMYSNR